MKAPPSWKIKKMYKCSVTLHKVTETAIGSDEYEFGQTTEVEETYTIKAEIQGITLQDMAFLPAGEVNEGDAWGFFLPSYFVDGEDIIVAMNDYISFKGIKYLVKRIIDFYDGNTTVYRRAFLKRQVGQ